MTTYNGKEVTRAGEILVSGDESKYDWAMDVVSYWRMCHEGPLEMALSKVEVIASRVDQRAFYSKRLKRTPSITVKLKRPENKNSTLRTMQDMGGCRIVASSNKRLVKILKELLKLPEFKKPDGTTNIRDYIQNPKPDGYRSIHLIGKFTDKTGNTKRIEVQVRTKLQHDWATTLEIIELFTGEALKSNGGSDQWKLFFQGMSDQLAAMENIHIFSQLKFEDQLARYREMLLANPEMLEHAHHVNKIARALEVSGRLDGFTETLQYSERKLANVKSGYALLIVDTENSNLKYKYFSPEESSDAEESYTEQEKKHRQNPSMTIALVHARKMNELKTAFPNYFADSRQFIGYLVLIAMAGRMFKPTILDRMARTFR